MSKDDLVYARHMLDTARRARALMEGKGRADFDSDEALRLALTHLVQIVGEAARRLSAEFRRNASLASHTDSGSHDWAAHSHRN